MLVTFGICFKQHFGTRYLVFYNPSPPPFGNRFLNNSGAVGLTLWIVYLHLCCKLTYANIYMSWYIISFFGFIFVLFLNILYFFKFSSTNIFHRRCLYTFYVRFPKVYSELQGLMTLSISAYFFRKHLAAYRYFKPTSPIRPIAPYLSKSDKLVIVDVPGKRGVPTVVPCVCMWHFDPYASRLPHWNWDYLMIAHKFQRGNSIPDRRR